MMAIPPSSPPPSLYSELATGSRPRTTNQKLGEAEIPYLIYDADGPPLIFLHATGFLPWLWHPLARELSPPYQVVAPYFCDHRETSPDDGGLSWLLLAQDLAEFCLALGLDSPFLVGHSMGATIMTLASSRFGLNARGMILIEPIFLPQDFYRLRITVEQHPLASKSIKRQNYWDSKEEADAYVRSRSLFKNWDDEMMNLYVQYGMKPGVSGGLQLACSPQREAALFMGGMQYDPWPDLAKVNCPVLILEGEVSENRKFIDLPKATSMFPKGTHQVIPGAGHLIPMEKPREIISNIRTFFDSLTG